MNIKCSSATNIPKLARAICECMCVCVCEWGGVSVCVVGGWRLLDSSDSSAFSGVHYWANRPLSHSNPRRGQRLCTPHLHTHHHRCLLLFLHLMVARVVSKLPDWPQTKLHHPWTWTWLDFFHTDWVMPPSLHKNKSKSCFFFSPPDLVLNTHPVLKELKTCMNVVTLRILPNSPHPGALSPPDMITKGRSIKVT